MAKEKRKQKNTIASDNLTKKQEDFCRNYVDTGIASEAYRMAYNTDNMKAETIWTQACRLLADPKVKARIAEIQTENDAMRKADRARVEAVLMDIINIDPAELYTIDDKTGKVRIKNPSQLSKRTRMAMKNITNNKGVVKYGFNSKTEAARLLGAWNGWNAPTQVNVTGSIHQDIRIGFDDDEE